MLRKILEDIIKGIILSLLYFEITKANDTTIKNIFLFVSFYIILINGALVLGIDPNVVTTAFVTKTIFTVVDERIKKNTSVQKIDENKTDISL